MEKANIIIKKCLVEQGITQKELAEKFGKSTQVFNNKMSKNSFSYDDFVKILDILGYEIKVDKKQK